MNWRSSVIDYIRREARPADKFGHQPRLYALSVQIGETLHHDDDVLFAAAWMHDLGVFVGHRPTDTEALARWNHVPYTIERCRELLPAWGFPPEKVDKVAEAIRTHQPHDEPQTPEGVILRDADILEQLGCVGVLRAMVKVGRDSRYPTYSAVLPVLVKSIEQLPARIRLDRTRALAEPRLEATRRFLASLDAEAGELLF